MRRQKKLVGDHIRTYDDMEDLILFITRFFNHKNIKYTVFYNERFSYYTIFFWLTDEEYKNVCKAYSKIH